MTEEKDSIKADSRQGGRHGRRSIPLLPALLLLGGATELLYLLIVALAPLPTLNLRATPLSTALPWTLAPSRLLFPGALTATTGGNGWPFVALFTLALIALTGVYVLVLLTAQRQKQHIVPSTRWLLIILGIVLVFSVTLLLQPALFSDDVFTYIASGRLLAVYHVDPLNSTLAQFLGDPYLQWAVTGRNTVSIFGPLWLYIASLLVVISNNTAVTLLLFKGVALLSHIANCLLLWAILGKLAPARRVQGTLLYAWNPLALIELAGNGHNDGLLITIFLLATWFYVQGKNGRGRWHTLAALVTFGFAVSMNLIALLIAPLFIWFLARAESATRTLWDFCWRMLIILAIAVCTTIPFWRGSPTFFAVTSAIDMAHFEHSPINLLINPTRWFFGLVAQWSNFPPVMQPTTAADTTLRASTIFIFALIFCYLFSKVHHATTTLVGMHYDERADQEITIPGFDTLLEGWGSAVFWYFVLVLGWFWPWYVLWALWIVALRRFDINTGTILLLSCTALLSYPLLAFAGTPLAQYQSLLIFGIPLVYRIVYRAWQRRLERNTPTYER